MSFTVSGALRGRPVSIGWLDPPGDPPGIRWTGDGEAIVEIESAIRGGVAVSPTPTGPCFVAAVDPPHVALVTAFSVLDDDVEKFSHGDVPKIPGLSVPEGATP